MKELYRLTSLQPTAIVGLKWEAGICYVSNPTGSPVFLRVGSPEIPNGQNADYTIPALGKETISVVGNQFGLAFADATLLSTSAVGNVAQVCTVQFQTPDEPLPQFGAASFQSLSLSEIVPLTLFTGVTTFTKLDLSAWGGAMIYVAPSSLSGQGVIQVDVSANGVNYLQLGTFTFWPGIPIIITVPRTVRYMQVTLNATAIPGEPAITGFVSLRATITEIQDLTYNASNTPISKTFVLPNFSSIQYQFVTVGLPAVSIAVISTAGSTIGADLFIEVETSADLVNWRRVTFRRQYMSQGITLYRALGNLDSFMRVGLFQEFGGNTLNATMYVSVPKEADLGYILNTILNAIGDVESPLNLNQDVYHELATALINDNTMIANQGTMISNQGLQITDLLSIINYTQQTAANTSGITTYLNSIQTQLNALGIGNITTILNAISGFTQGTSSNTSGITTYLNTIQSLLGALGAGNLTTILNAINASLGALGSGNLTTILNAVNTILGTINTAIGAGNLTTLLNALKTDLDSVVALQTGNAQWWGGNVGIAAIGTWTNSGNLLPVGSRIIAVQMSGNDTGILTSTNLLAAIGNNVAPTLQIYAAYGLTSTGGYISSPTFVLESIRSAGLLVPSGQNTLWVQSGFIGTIAVQVSVTP